MIKTALSFIGGFLFGFVIIWGWNAYQERTDRIDVPPADAAPARVARDASTTRALINESIDSIVESNVISVTTQPSGDTVLVDAATLEADGWIVVHEEKNGLIGNALGAVRRDAGAYRAVEVPLLRATLPNARYWVVLYRDNGDRQFQFSDDTPLRDSAGTTIMKSFYTQ